MKLDESVLFWVILFISFFNFCFWVTNIFLYSSSGEYVDENEWCKELKYNKQTLLQHNHGAKGYFRYCRNGSVIVYIPNVGKEAHWYKEDFKLIEKNNGIK